MKRTTIVLAALALTAQLAAAPAAPAETDDTTELETLRSIGVANMATVADLCNVIAIDLGKLAEFETADDRCAHLTELGILNTAKVEDIYSAPATHGAAAKAAILTFELERSLMFRITGSEWYAIQSAETLAIVPENTKGSKSMSGEELLAIMAKGRELAEEQDDWGIEKNVYEQFGQSTYEEVDKEYVEDAAPAATDTKKGKTP